MEIQKSGSSVSLKFFALSDAKRIRTLSPITKKNFLRWAGLKKNDQLLEKCSSLERELYIKFLDGKIGVNFMAANIFKVLNL